MKSGSAADAPGMCRRIPHPNLASCAALLDDPVARERMGQIGAERIGTALSLGQIGRAACQSVQAGVPLSLAPVLLNEQPQIVLNVLQPMTNDSATHRSGFEQFRREFAAGWSALPYKGHFSLSWGLGWLCSLPGQFHSRLHEHTVTCELVGLDHDKEQRRPTRPLVLVGVLALLWWSGGELSELPKRSWWPALVVIGGAILLHTLGYMVQQTRISMVGFFAGIYGIIGLVWGPQMMRASSSIFSVRLLPANRRNAR